jgi:branched-chain amino acid transport system permease protein
VPPAQVWVSIVEIGCFYALIAVAYLVVMQGAGFFNFAIGPYAMVGGLGGAYLASQAGWPGAAAIVAGIGMSVLLGLLTELLVVRPIETRAPGQELAALVAMVSVLFAVQQGAATAFGRRPLPGSRWIHGDLIRVGPFAIDPQSLVLVAGTLVMFVALAFWLRYATYGQLLRAVGDNKHAARVLGLPFNRIRLVAFGVAGLVAGVAGSLFAPKAGVSFDAGLLYTMSGLLAFVIGGTGSIWAPLVGGLLFAAMQLLATLWFGSSAIHYVTLAIALAFFAFRPGGLFERRMRT